MILYIKQKIKGWYCNLRKKNENLHKFYDALKLLNKELKGGTVI